MLSERERKRRAKTRARAKINSWIKSAQDRGIEIGKLEGKREAAKASADDLRAQERKANIELARSLSSTLQSIAQAVGGFIGEGGLRP